jgi:ElaB/YqjD/DUF883 family membrane-anchored ribosome-binding protein
LSRTAIAFNLRLRVNASNSNDIQGSDCKFTLGSANREGQPFMDDRTPEPFANQELAETAKQPLPVSEIPPITHLEGAEFVLETEPPTVTDRFKHQASRVADRARYRGSVLYDQAQSRLAAARVRAQQGWREARSQGRDLANEYPVQMVAGIAGAAFVTGMMLRFWRSSRYE